MTLLSGPPAEISASVFLNLKCYMASHLLSDKEAHVCSALALCHSSASFYCFLTTALWERYEHYYSSILAWRIPMDSGAGRATVHGSQSRTNDWVAEDRTARKDENSRLREVSVLCRTEVVVWIFKDRPLTQTRNSSSVGTPLSSSWFTALSVCCSSPPQPWVSLVPDQIALISVPKALSQPVPLLPLAPAHLTPARVRAPGPWLSWQENKDSWQWENPVKENMSAVVVMALLSENSLCQRTALASHTCYMDRCFQLLSLTSLRARFFSDWLLRDSEGTKGNWG